MIYDRTYKGYEIYTPTYKEEFQIDFYAGPHNYKYCIKQEWSIKGYADTLKEAKEIINSYINGD